MKCLHEPVKILIANALKSAYEAVLTKEAWGLDLTLTTEFFYDQLIEPPQKELGQLTYGCFGIAKNLKKNPAMIAQLMAQNISLEFVSQVLAAGPYLNIKIKPSVLYKFVVYPMVNKEAFTRKLTQQNPKTMIEYSQPNTHKELHVGHMRNLCLGNALVRSMRYAGYEVISTTFPGDVGTHVAKCLWYLKFHNKEATPTERKGEWLGRMYTLAHIKLEDELGTSQEIDNREKLTMILKQLEKKEGEFYDLWKETRQWSIELMNSVYQWAGVSFDQWYWESDVDSASVEYAKKLYADGKLVQSQGAIGMDLEDSKLGFCMLLKSDGTGLYATKDIELAKRKFQDYQIENNIYVVDLRQALHFQQVFKVLENLGFEQSKNCFHLQYNFVELPDGAMSSRKGNIVALKDLIEQMQNHVKNEYLVRYESEWETSEIEHVAKIVAEGAIKYGMVKQDSQKKIVFDMQEWLKLDGESGPFIQYSYARIQSIIRKNLDESQLKKILNQPEPEWMSLLTHESEVNLVQFLIQFNTVCVQAAENNRPAMICNYIYDLAKRFNSFYHDCSVAHAENENLLMSRAALCMATGETLKQGLALIGIQVPERM